MLGRKELLEEFEQFIAMPARTFQVLKIMFTTGCFEIETAFQHKNKSYIFSTLMQIDADVINYIPDPKLMLNDGDFKTKYQEHQQIHLQKVASFVQTFQGDLPFWEKLFDGFLVMTNAVPLYTLITDLSVEGGVTSATVGTVSLLSRKFLKGKVTEQVSKRFFKLAGWGVNLYIKKKQTSNKK